MISANGVEYKNLPEQVQYLTEKAAEFAVDLDRVSASVESVAGDVAALQTSYTALAEDMRVAKININALLVNFGTAFTEITNIKNGTTHLFETITDKHGNPRFVEGDITMNTIEGATQKYGKWSLSGSHLMIVLMGELSAGYTFPTFLSSNIVLPSWIRNKIVRISGDVVTYSQMIIARKSTSGGIPSTNNIATALLVWPDSYAININQYSAKDYDQMFRVQFDILIDAS